MPDPIWLTPDELHQLTGRKRWSAQARALASAQIPFRLNTQGRPLVERSAVITTTTKTAAPKAPRWERLNANAP